MYRTKEDIYAIIKSGESFHMECKKAQGGLPGSLWESYSAFCNTDGGVILLGVKEFEDKHFEVIGVDDEAQLIKSFWDTIHNPEKISTCVLGESDVCLISCDGKKVLVIDVPRADRKTRPVYIGANAFEGTFRRNGEGDYKCTRESVESMIRDRCDETADTCLMDELTEDDLNYETIRRYRRRFLGCKPTSTWNSLSDRDFLKNIGALRKDREGLFHPTLAGLVCFGDFVTIATHVPNYFVDYREKLTGETRWNDRVCAHDGTWSGNIYDFFFQIHDKIVADVRKPFAIAKDGITRIDENEVHESIREVLANALIHADYHGRRGIVIEKHFRQIILENPGCFRVPREEAVSGGCSDARNHLIFNIFALVDIGERSGHGLSNLFGVWKKSAFSQPTIHESYDPDRTTIELKLDDELLAQPPVPKTDTELAQANPELTQNWPKTDPEILLDLPASVKQVYSALCEDQSFTLRGIARKLGVSKTTVTTAIATLISSSLLRRVGPKKGGHWEVVKPQPPTGGDGL